MKLKVILISTALIIAGCDRASTPEPNFDLPPDFVPVEPAPVVATPPPTPTPTPAPKWELSPGWTQFKSKEGKEMAYTQKDWISCRDGHEYCFQMDVMARTGCPNGLYVEGQIIDIDTNTVTGWGNDLLPRLEPGQVGRISLGAKVGTKVSWEATCRD